MKLIVGLIVGRALIVLRFKQRDGYDGDGGGGDEGASGDGRAGKGGEGVRRRRQGRGWMEAQMAAAVRAVAARVAGGEGGGCDSGGGVGGHEGGGAGADGHVGDDHQELGLGDQRRTVVLLAPAAGKREAFAREVEGRWVGRKASNAVPANA